MWVQNPAARGRFQCCQTLIMRRQKQATPPRMALVVGERFIRLPTIIAVGHRAFQGEQENLREIRDREQAVRDARVIIVHRSISQGSEDSLQDVIHPGAGILADFLFFVADQLEEAGDGMLSDVSIQIWVYLLH